MNIIYSIQLLPILVFFTAILCLRIDVNSTTIAFQNAFISAAICSILTIVIELMRKNIFDRFILAIDILFIIVATALIVPLSEMIYYIDMYKFPFMYICLAIVGVITTLFTNVGFVGIAHNNKTDVQNTSWILVLIAFIMAIWSFFTKNTHWIISFLIPYLILRSFYDNVRKGLKNRAT